MAVKFTYVYSDKPNDVFTTKQTKYLNTDTSYAPFSNEGLLRVEIEYTENEY